jgi:hypothetical protein
MRREVALVAASCVAVAPAHADPAADQLRRARATLEASNYGDAQPLLAAALASGAYGPADVAELYELTGIATAALGDAAKATDAFERALALMPSTALNRGASPRIARLFAAAKQQLAGRALHATVDSGPESLRLTIEDDPLSMVVGAQVESLADPVWQPVVARTANTIEIALPPGGYRTALVDAQGNRLAELRPITITDHINRIERAGETPDHDAPLWTRWYTYAAPAAAAFALAAGFGVAAQNRTDNLSALLAMAPHYTYPEAQLLYNRARGDAVDANVLFAVGGALAAATAATVVYDLFDRHRAERLAILPTSTGATIACRLAF